MNKVFYVYQNYSKSYSSASLSILRALRDIENIKVDHFEIKPFSHNNILNRVMNRLPFIRSFHFKRQNRLLEKELLMIDAYDMLFVMKGTDIKSDTLERVKKFNPSMKLVCFNPDDPFNMASSNTEIIASIKLYDIYFIWTKLLNDKLNKAGANKVAYFPFGIDETIIYPVEASYKYDISFIGNGDAERHKLIQDMSSEMINRGLNIKIHVFGSNWPNLGENIIIHGQRNGEELMKTISASKINLNLLRKQNKNSINMRTFEIPAAGGFMLHEKSVEAECFFSPKDEVAYFETIIELVDKCEFYLNNEKNRKKLIDNAAKRISDGKYSYHSIIESSLKSIFSGKKY